MKRNGFTLIEILTAVAIIALLSALIVGMAGHAQKSSARKKAEAQIAELGGFISDYRSDKGVVPKDMTALSNELVKASHSLTNLVDPWGDPYNYETPAGSRFIYYLWSCAGDDKNPVGWIGTWP